MKMYWGRGIFVACGTIFLFSCAGTGNISSNDSPGSGQTSPPQAYHAMSCFERADVTLLAAMSYIEKTSLQVLLDSIDNSPGLYPDNKIARSYIAKKVYGQQPDNYLIAARETYLSCNSEKEHAKVGEKTATQCLLYTTLAHAGVAMKSKGVPVEKARDELNNKIYGEKVSKMRRGLALSSDVDTIIYKAYRDDLLFETFNKRLFSTCISELNANIATGKVTEIISGDHVRLSLDSGKKDLEVYLAGLRAPKPGEEGYEESIKALGELTQNKDFIVSYYPFNDYFVAKLFNNQKDIAGEMIRAGHGKFDKKDLTPSSSISQSSLGLASLLSQYKKKKHDKADKPKPVVFWNKIEHGMNESAVLALAENSHPTQDQDILQSGAKKKISIDSVKLYDFNARADFYFLNDGLDEILFNVDVSKESSQNIFSNIKDQIRRQYGREDFNGATESQALNTKILIWHVVDRFISVTLINMPNRKPLLTVTYQKYDKKKFANFVRTYGE